MKRKLIAALGATVLVAGLAACGSDDGGNASKDPADRDEELTVWLMNDAESTWPDLVKDVNARFKDKYPKVKVNIQYQQWGDKTKKLDAALGGSKFPDVVELGNTETLTYILNGALAEVDEKKYDNSDSWVQGLKDTCTYEGKLYCVPYYSAARVALHNTEMFEKATGSAKVPETEAGLRKALGELGDEYGSDAAFSPLYLPGKYWYAAMSYVTAYGGQIATSEKDGEDGEKWKATLSEPAARKGIQHFADLISDYNNADKTKDELDHANVMANEKTAMLYGNAFEVARVTGTEQGNKKLKGKIETAVMPGPGGKPLPSFIGGSDLGVIEKSGVKDLAEDWISMFTSEKAQEKLASKKILPNNTKQLEPLKDDPETAPAAKAVTDAWFTPIAPGWAAIEKQNVLPNMLVSIVKGESVKSATAKADKQIDELINNDA
ncbi:extracellular solute-binding protein [Streptomyces sp. AJS327]|uniref:extracellular solute-binding protein n=1 Tax=Streptomyces sp. AJS327 TaxID=2545265 RepID=UPI0015DFF0C2|nr:extracellular solute-binding protein [Streptomyces sp. AJS327]MBA0051510.1 extracellular solute-binding protein [Streptomyces sp. AJS327]